MACRHSVLVASLGHGGKVSGWLIDGNDLYNENALSHGLRGLESDILGLVGYVLGRWGRWVLYWF